MFTDGECLVPKVQKTPNPTIIPTTKEKFLKVYNLESDGGREKPSLKKISMSKHFSKPPRNLHFLIFFCKNCKSLCNFPQHLTGEYLN